MIDKYKQQIQILEDLMKPDNVSHYSWIMILGMAIMYFGLKKEVKNF
jgi:hypothetical protein